MCASKSPGVLHKWMDFKFSKLENALVLFNAAQNRISSD